MKATLTFRLPYDEQDFEAARCGMRWALLVWDVDQEIRRLLKYDESLPEEAGKHFELIRDLIRERMLDEGLVFPT